MSSLTMNSDLAALQSALGHTFKRPEMLERALTHSSHAHEESKAGGSDASVEILDNEQFEFLGDAVLGLVTSQLLFEKFPTFHEGQLSKLKAHLVSAEHLVGVATRIGLGKYLRLGRGEERSGGRSKGTLLSDALEAVIAAMYLDADWKRRGNSSSGRSWNPNWRRLLLMVKVNSALRTISPRCRNYCNPVAGNSLFMSR